MSFASLKKELNVSRSRANSSVSSCNDAGVAISELVVGWTLLEPFILLFQMLERSIKHIIVGGDMLDLSRKG